MRGIAAGMGLPLPGAWRALSGAAGVGVGLGVRFSAANLGVVPEAGEN